MFRVEKGAVYIPRRDYGKLGRRIKNSRGFNLPLEETASSVRKERDEEVRGLRSEKDEAGRWACGIKGRTL